MKEKGKAGIELKRLGDRIEIFDLSLMGFEIDSKQIQISSEKSVAISLEVKRSEAERLCRGLAKVLGLKIEAKRKQ